MSDTIDELVDDPMLRQRLERHLERSAEGVEIRRTTVTAVIRRADVRRRRQRTAAALGAACLVVTAVGAVIAGRSDDPTIVNVDEPPAVSTESTDNSTPTTGERLSTTTTSSGNTDTDDMDAAALTPTELAWSSVVPDGMSETAFDFMISTNPSSGPAVGWVYNEMSPADFTSLVFLSDDDGSWRDVPVSPSLAVLGGTRLNDRIDLVGYVSGDDPEAGQLVLSSSVDNGASWTRHPLGIDLSEVWDEPSVFARFMPSQIARQDDVLVFSLEISSTLNLAPVLGDETAFSAGYTITDDGVAIFEPCSTCPSGQLASSEGRTVSRTLSWEELGLDPEERDFLDVPRSFYVVTTGAPVSVQVPFADAAGAVTLSSSARGILAVEQSPYAPMVEGQSPAPAILYESPDGVTWTEVGQPPVQLGSAGVIGERYVVVGPSLDEGSNEVVASNPDGSWTTVRLPEPETTHDGGWGLIPVAAFGDDSLALVLTNSFDPLREVGGASVTRNGVIATIQGSDVSLVLTDEATGEIIGSTDADDADDEDLVRIDGNTIVALDPSGRVRASFDMQELFDAANLAISTVDVPLSIIQTTDLTTWSELRVNDLVARPIGVSWLRVTKDGLIATVAVDRDADPTTYETDHRVLVGVRP